MALNENLEATLNKVLDQGREALETGRKVAEEGYATAREYADKGYAAACEYVDKGREYMERGIEVADSVAEDVRGFVRREPWIALIGAAAVGYAAARILRRLSR
jgi:ElaB/YqjD/DUF883 family membrane-anchored ribosome-binding protein